MWPVRHKIVRIVRNVKKNTRVCLLGARVSKRHAHCVHAWKDEEPKAGGT